MFRFLSFGRSLTCPDGKPLRLSSKLFPTRSLSGGQARMGKARSREARASAAPMAEALRKGKRRHELRPGAPSQTDEVDQPWEPYGHVFRFNPERSDKMSASPIKAAAASLLAIAIAGCTTTGVGYGQSTRGNLGATFTWSETGGTRGTMVAQLSNGQVFQGPFFQITSESIA